MHTWSRASSDLHPQARGQRLGATPLRWLLIACASLIGALGVLVMPATSLGQAGITWTSQNAAAANVWTSVTYGNGLFVAVASSGTGNRVMTSPDGITWTIRTSVPNNFWNSVTYGNGLFVAVASTGIGNRVMTSPDGITWTSRTSYSADNFWKSVTYGNDLFVAVASTGLVHTNWVMTSPNGITWFGRRDPVHNAWVSVTYGNGLFVAVSLNGTLYRVMTSPDGITWTHRTAAVNNDWISVTYGNGLFVAVSTSGFGNRVMTSPDGSTWTSRTSAANNTWTSVTYGNGLFVAVSLDGTNNRVMTSGTFIPPTPATPTATAGNAGATTPTAPVNAFTMKILKTSRKSITTRLNLPGPGKVVQKATTPLLTPRRSSQMAKKARRMTVCTADKTVAKAGKVTITCRLTAKARAARKTHSLKVRLVTTFTPTGGTAKSLSTTLVLKKTR